MEKPVFYYRKEQQVKASGVILYKYDGCGYLYFLMIKKSNPERYSDLGGKVEVGDSSIRYTASREVSEESNGLIKKSSILWQLNREFAHIFLCKSKYLLFFIRANEFQMNLESSDFGISENGCDGYRTIEWVRVDLLFNSDITFLHPRLRNIEFITFVKEYFLHFCRGCIYGEDHCRDCEGGDECCSTTLCYSCVKD